VRAVPQLSETVSRTFAPFGQFLRFAIASDHYKSTRMKTSTEPDKMNINPDTCCKGNGSDRRAFLVGSNANFQKQKGRRRRRHNSEESAV